MEDHTDLTCRFKVVYRLTTRGTVEERLLLACEGKIRLEKLVIKKGGVTSDHTERNSTAAANETLIDELRNLLRKSDGETFNADRAVLREEELAILLDRSDEAYVRAEQGMDKMDGAFKTFDMEAAGELLQGLET
jgi:ATP-dependent DNA helicase